jgi:hypothetical protein
MARFETDRMNIGITEIATKGSKSFQRLNRHLLHPQPVAAQAGKAATIAQDGAKPRLRQRSGDGLNKLERRFREWHRLNLAHHQLFTQFITLKIANGCRYTPDFVSVDIFSSEMHAWEVKGPHAWDDAIVKLKVAASLYPFISFTLVSWDKAAGVWRMETVKP